MIGRLRQPLLVGCLAFAVGGAAGLATPAAPVGAGGPVTVTYPGASCPQEGGLQGCITSVEAGSTIRIANEIVNEDIQIRKSIRLVGVGDLWPQLDSVDIARSGSAIQVLLRDLRVEGGVVARFTGGAWHELTIERVTVQGTVPNTGSGITVDASVPVTFHLLRSVVQRVLDGRASVQFDTFGEAGGSTFRAIGNRISQHGSNGSAGFFVRLQSPGEGFVRLMNNTIWDTGRCRCGISAGIGVAVAAQARVDVDIVGNTIERARGDGIHLRNDTEGDGLLRVDVFDTIIAHTSGGKAISRASLTGATTLLRTGYNDVWRTGSSPGSPLFGPGTRFVDPRFVDRDDGDLRLRADSPLIDAGLVCSPGGLVNPDVAGNHRLAGRSVDIGAHERDAVPPTGIVLMGDDAPETHVGTRGADIICGFEAADHLDGKGGPDHLDGGPGPDTLIGGRGADHLLGRGGADLLCGADGAGTDRLDGGNATDRYAADQGDVRVSVEQPDGCSPT